MSFFKLLSEYGPTSQNNASFDEHVKKTATRIGIPTINIDNGLLDKLYNVFISSPTSLIISGSAGDGKTYLLRNIFEKLGGSEKTWYEFIPEIKYNDFSVKFLKDFTQLEKKDKKQTLKGLYNSILGENNNELYIIAANDGILTDTLRGDELYFDSEEEKNSFNKLLSIIEDKIDHKENSNEKLVLLDLSQTSSAKNFDLLLKEVLHYCDKYNKDCPSLLDPNIFCSIHSNINLLKNPIVQERLKSVIQSCDLNYNHISLRKIFMLISNMILGNSSNNKIFKACNESIKYYENNKDRFSSAFFNNIFADNLSQNYKTEKPFKELRELGIGFETSNNIDNFLLYKHNGKRDISDLYDKAFKNPFLDFNEFNNKRLNYMQEGKIDDIENYLISLRRYLYFTLDDNNVISEISFKIQSLNSYRYILDFINNIIKPLKNKEKIDKKIIKKFVTGFNRIFLGELLSENGSDRLYVASSLTNSVSKISSEIITSIEINKKGINEGVEFKLIEGFDEEYCKIIFKVNKYNKNIAEIEIDLHMFEFIMRVSEGILPTSFSVEYYEKVLGFKSQIINYIFDNYLSEEDETLNDTFNMFQLNDNEGIIEKYELQVDKNYVRKS